MEGKGNNEIVYIEASRQNDVLVLKFRTIFRSEKSTRCKKALKENSGKLKNVHRLNL